MKRYFTIIFVLILSHFSGLLHAQTDSVIVNHIVILIDRGATTLPKTVAERKELQNLITKKLPLAIKEKGIVLKNGDFISLFGYGIKQRWQGKKVILDNDYLYDLKFIAEDYSYNIFNEISGKVVKNSKSFFDKSSWGIHEFAKAKCFDKIKETKIINNTYFIQIYSKVLGNSGNYYINGIDNNDAISEWSYFVKLDIYKDEKIGVIPYKQNQNDAISNYYNKFENNNKLFQTKNYSCYFYKLESNFSGNQINKNLAEFNQEDVSFKRVPSGYISNFTITKNENQQYSILKIKASLINQRGQTISDTIIDNISDVNSLNFYVDNDKIEDDLQLNLKFWVKINDSIYNCTVINPYDKSEISKGLNYSISTSFSEPLILLPNSFYKLSSSFLGNNEMGNAIFWWILYIIILFFIAKFINKKISIDRGNKTKFGGYIQIPPDKNISIDFNTNDLPETLITSQKILNTESKNIAPLSWSRRVSYKHCKVWIEITEASNIDYDDKEIFKLQLSGGNDKKNVLEDFDVNKDEVNFNVFLNPKAITNYTKISNQDGKAFIKFKIFSQSNKGKGIIESQEYVIPVKFEKAKLKPKFELDLTPEFIKGYMYKAIPKVHLGNMRIESYADYNGNPISYTQKLTCSGLQAYYEGSDDENIIILGDIDEVKQTSKSDIITTNVEKSNLGYNIKNISGDNVVEIPIYVDLTKLENPEKEIIHSFYLSFDARDENGEKIIVPDKKMDFKLIQDPTKTGLLSKIQYDGKEESLDEGEKDLYKSCQWLRGENNKKRYSTCFELMLGNKAKVTQNKEEPGKVYITDLNIRFFISENSNSIIKPNKVSDEKRIEISDIFKITPTPNIEKRYTFLSEINGSQNFRVELIHGKIQEITGDFANIECEISFDFLIHSPEHNKDRHTNKGEFKQNVSFKINKDLGPDWLALDLGTSAIVAHFSDGTPNSKSELNLQKALDKHIDYENKEHKDAINKEKDIFEYGTNFLSSISLLREDKDKIYSLYSNNYINNLVKISPSKQEIMGGRHKILPFLKSLIGYESLPDYNNIYRDYKYKNSKGKVTKFSENPITIDDILGSTYSSVFRDFIEPSIKIKNNGSFDRELNKMILTVPNTFTPRHRDYIKKIIKTNEHTKTINDNNIIFISESDAVASYYVTNYVELNELRKTNEFLNTENGKTENVLVYDMGAGTLDLTYFSIKHSSNNEKYIDIIGKTGNTKAGNYLDYIIAKRFVQQYGHKLPINLQDSENLPLGEYGIKLKGIVKDFIKPDLYGEGPNTQGKKQIIINSFINISKLLFNNEITAYDDKTFTNLIKKLKEYLKLNKDEVIVVEARTKDLDKIKVILSKIIEILDIDVDSDLSLTLSQRDNEINIINEKTAKIQDIINLNIELFKHYKVSSLSNLITKLNDILNEIKDTEKTEQNRLEELEKNLSLADKEFEKLTKNKFKDDISFESSVYDEITSSFGSTNDEVHKLVGEYIKNAPEQLESMEFFFRCNVSSLLEPILEYKQQYEGFLEKISNYLKDDSNGYYPDFNSIELSIKKYKEKINEEKDKVRLLLEEKSEYVNFVTSKLNSNPNNIIGDINKLDEVYSENIKFLNDKLEMSEFDINNVNIKIKDLEESKNIVDEEIRSILEIADKSNNKTEIDKRISEKESAEKEIQEILKISEISNIKQRVESFLINKRVKIKEIAETLGFGTYSDKDNIESNIDNITDLIEKSYNELNLLLTNNNVLVLPGDPELNPEDIHIDLNLINAEKDENGNLTEYGDFLENVSSRILNNLFGLFIEDNKEKVARVDTLILTGRSVNLKGIRSKVFETLKQITGNENIFNVSIVGDELKEVVAKGAIPFATHYRHREASNIKFSERKIFAKYGLLSHTGNGWEWIEFLKPSDDIIFSELKPVDGELISTFSVKKENIDIFNTNICHFVQTYHPDPVKAMKTDNEDYITKIMTFLKSDIQLAPEQQKNITIELILNNKDEMIIDIANGALRNTPESSFKINVDQNELFKKVMWPYI